MELCLAKCASCHCGRVVDHEGPHLCACEGSWLGTEGQPDWVPVAMPTRYVGRSDE